MDLDRPRKPLAANPYEKLVESNPYETLAKGKQPSEKELQRAAAEDAMSRGWGTGAGAFIHELGGKVTDLTGSPLAGAATNFLANAVPSFFMATKGMPTHSPEQASATALATQRQAVLGKGRELGLRVPPSQANPSATNRILESIAGKHATAQQASAANQNVAYRVAQQEAGLAPNEPIARETLKAARTRMVGPYEEIANLKTTGPLSNPPFKSPAETLNELKDARYQAKNLWKFYNRQGNPQTLKEAQAASSRVEALEKTLEAQAADAGRPDLVKKLREARMAIAKNFTVKRALRGSSFDPAELSKLESRGDAPLGGDLETLMQMYRDFPGAMKAPQVAGSVGVNQLLPWLGGSAGGVAGAMLGGAQGAGLGAPAGVMLGQTLPPLTRSMILSQPYQALFANAPQQGLPSLLRMLANPAVAEEASGILYP